MEKIAESTQRRNESTIAGIDEPPRLSIGLPVYNGENFLAEALDSILSQTFTDFELLISDNASTDRTSEICLEYARMDPRILFFQNEENLGAAPNFNDLVERARGSYFKWMAHDDIHASDFLERCVRVLDANPSVILSFSKAVDLSPEGEVLQPHDFELRVDDERPHVRFHDWIHMLHMCVAVFGVIRTDVLRKTALIGAYTASDRTLLAELSLHGTFHEIPDVLFFRREHPQRHMRVYDDDHERLAWFDPKLKRRFHLPALRRGSEYIAAVSRAPLGMRESFKCYLEIFTLITRKSVRHRIWNDFVRARMARS